MSAMIDHISSRSQSEEGDEAHVVYFFCKKGDEATSLGNRIFLHVLIQLYEKAAQGKSESNIELKEKFSEVVKSVYEESKPEHKVRLIL